VAGELAVQLESGSRQVMGIMLESFLVAGSQSVRPRSELTVGQSITDACLGWDDTIPVLETLARAAQRRS
jgi:3-deoxy-7-phosphoheptulonate synthase